MSSEGSTAPKQPYEPPKLTVLGSVAALTQESPKLHGMSDGHGFGSHGGGVINASR